MHPMLRTFNEFWPVETWQHTTLVAVSGGADSVALLKLLVESRCERSPDRLGRLIAVHFNHRLRGTASDEDAAFVQQLAWQLGAEFIAESAPPGPENQAFKDGLEAKAREDRYRFFQKVAKDSGARLLVTAHHQGDQVETILHRVARGTGIAGLAGIETKREWIPGVGLVRPLLGFSKGDLLNYLTDCGQAYRVDHTNAETIFTRNKIRHKVLPVLRNELGPNVDQSLIKLAEQARQCQQVIDDLVQQLWGQAIHAIGEGVEIDRNSIRRERPYLLRELFVAIWKHQNWPRRDMSQQHWERLSTLIQADEETSIDLPGSIRATLARDRFRLVPIQ